MLAHQLAALLRRLRASPAACALAIPLVVLAGGIVGVLALTGWPQALTACLSIAGLGLTVWFAVLVLTGRDQL
jgi:hypothetical protein